MRWFGDYLVGFSIEKGVEKREMGGKIYETTSIRLILRWQVLMTATLYEESFLFIVLIKTICQMVWGAYGDVSWGVAQKKVHATLNFG